MRRQHKPLNLIVILLLVVVLLASATTVSSPADANDPALSTRPSYTDPSTESTEATQSTTETSQPTDPSETTEATLPPETTPPTIPPETTAPTKPSEPAGPSIQSPHAFVYDCRTGEFLYQTGDLHEKLYPASITKLFTAYVALMYLKPTDVAAVGNILETLPSDSSIALLNPKDKLSVSDLILGMLLPSGGDAARVLAVAAGKQLLGSTDQTEYTYYEAFVDEMNRQAKLLGLNDSHFENPDGYHDPDHYISLADAARLGKLCLSSTLIMRGATTQVHMATVRNTGREIQWVNTNKLLFEHRYPEFYCAQAIGLKTGYTSKAGNCLLSAFQVEDGHLIIGVFGSDSRDARFYDTLKLFKYADT